MKYTLIALILTLTVLFLFGVIILNQEETYILPERNFGNGGIQTLSMGGEENLNVRILEKAQQTFSKKRGNNMVEP